jgi:hypothetical protein
MMEAVRTSETSVDNHFTRQYIPEDNSEHQDWFKLTKNSSPDQSGEFIKISYEYGSNNLCLRSSHISALSYVARCIVSHSTLPASLCTSLWLSVMSSNWFQSHTHVPMNSFYQPL